MYDLNPNYYVNDIVKINSNQIYYSSTSQDKRILYIIKLNFYNEFSKFVIRYYTIRLYELYRKKFLKDFKLIPFGNYLSLASCLCPSSQCSSNNDNHFSYLMIFSYPNSTDINYDLIEHLCDLILCYDRDINKKKNDNKCIVYYKNDKICNKNSKEIEILIINKIRTMQNR